MPVALAAARSFAVWTLAVGVVLPVVLEPVVVLLPEVLPVDPSLVGPAAVADVVVAPATETPPFFEAVAGPLVAGEDELEELVLLPLPPEELPPDEVEL